MANDIELKRFLTTSLKNQFWEDYMDAWSEEFELLRTDIQNTEDYFNVRTQTDSDRLIEIGKTFGFNIDRSINQTTSYLKNNLKVLTNRIKHKTTYTGYNYIFSLAEYFGVVYNLYINNEIFTRGLDLTTIYSNLSNITDFSKAFKGFKAELYYKIDSQDYETLDETPTEYLDETPTEYLDEDAQRQSSIHLAIEYVPENLISASFTTTASDGFFISDEFQEISEYYMNTTYLDYLLTASLYNKKTTEIPHVGVQINAITDTSGYFNNLSLDDNYTVPDLKLICSTNIENYFNNEYTVQLDAINNEEKMDLDKEILWQLDQGTNITFDDGSDLEDIFTTIEWGDGIKGLISKNYPYLNDGLILYWDFDTGTNTFFDRTENAYNGTLFGNYTRGYSIIGQGVKFGGGYGKKTNIQIDPTEESLSFWIRGESSNNLGITTLIHIYTASGNDYLQIQYNNNTKNIIISMTGNTITSNFDLLDNEDHNLIITFNNTTNKYNLFVDGENKNIQDFGGNIPTSLLDYEFYIANNQSLNQNFTGYIDEIRFYNRVLSVGEIAFLYSSKLGNMSSLGNLLYSSTNFEFREENSNWYIITARLDFQTEIQAIIDDDVTYPTTFNKRTALISLYNTKVNIREIGIKDTNGIMKFYCQIPTCEIYKKNHISINIMIKKP